MEALKRDRWGNPYIRPATGGRAVRYKRVSKFASVLQDNFKLEQWKKRQVILGLTVRNDLFEVAKKLGPEAKSALDAIASDAMDAAGAHKAAEAGTEMHSITEALDLGDQVAVPQEWMGYVQIYRTTLDRLGIKTRLAEQFIANDEVKAAGTFDRVFETPDGDMMGDLKTGKWAGTYNQATAVQIATYANGSLYDPATGTHSPLPDTMRKDVGLLIHLPFEDKPECTVYALDLEWGWKMAQTTAWVIEQRKKKVSQVFQPGVSLNF